MGFFKDFKNDMKQAVNELIPGNEEMISEYDDEDMVNTLEEPEDAEYINTMDAPGEDLSSGAEDSSADGVSEDDFGDIAIEDLDDLDIDAEEFEEESANYESDMDSLADLLSGNLTIEDVERQEIPHAENQESEVSYESAEEQEPLDMMDTVADTVEDGDTETDAASAADIDMLLEEIEAEEDEREEDRKEETEELVKEEALVSEDKIIDITSIKETEIAAEPVPSSGTESSNDELEDAVSDSTTYITKGTRIEGNVFTDGSIDIIGTVEGDVNCYGKLIISGSINGKVNAGEIYANAAKVEGEIVSAGSVKIGVGSVIVGNIEAQSAVIAGAVHGDLDVKGPVIVDSTAVIMGNIKSRSVQINNGAVIEGFCSQCYSDIDVKSFFA